jgi:hypothetical protein
MTSPPRDRQIPDLVTLAEASRKLGLSKAYIHRQYVTPGVLRGALIGGTWVFRRAAVERLRDQRAAAKEKPDA